MIDKILFHLFLWSGSRLFHTVVVTPQDPEDEDAPVSGVLFTNDNALGDAYCDIPWPPKEK